MKKYIYTLLLAIVATLCVAQDYDNYLIDLDVMNDPVSGYRYGYEIVPDTNTYEPLQKVGLHKWYQCDAFGNKVRQIVVLKEKYANCPKEILDNGGGYKVVALTPKEMISAHYYADILTEVWQRRSPDYRSTKWYEAHGNKPGWEILCYLSIDNVPMYGAEQRAATRELMIFCDSITGKRYLTVARNYLTGVADYTPTSDSTGGRYDTQFMQTLNRQEERYLWKVYKEWKASQSN